MFSPWLLTSHRPDNSSKTEHTNSNAILFTRPTDHHPNHSDGGINLSNWMVVSMVCCIEDSQSLSSNIQSRVLLLLILALLFVSLVIPPTYTN